MPSYTTLQQCRSQRNIEDDTTADQALADLIESASQAIEDICGQNFDCRIDTKGFSGEVGALNPTLNLEGYPLLAETAVLNGNDEALTTAQYTILPRYGYPKTHIRLAQGVYWVAPGAPPGAITTPTYSPMLDYAYAEDAISITGKWGFHRQFGSAWKRSSVVVGAGGIDATATTLPITGSNLLQGSVPKIDVGHVLQIGGEFMKVTGPVLSTITATELTVERGYNNSTAATHDAATVIDVWSVEPVIAWCAAEAVAASYGARQSASGESVDAPGGYRSATVDIPKRVLDKLIWPYFNPVRGVMPGRSS